MGYSKRLVEGYNGLTLILLSVVSTVFLDVSDIPVEVNVLVIRVITYCFFSRSSLL